MTELSITRPSTIEQFLATLSAHGVKLPLDITDEDVGTLVDADGRTVLVVDVDRERSDEDVAWIVGMIMVAVNTCGGFKATIVPLGIEPGQPTQQNSAGENEQSETRDAHHLDPQWMKTAASCSHGTEESRGQPSDTSAAKDGAE